MRFNATKFFGPALFTLLLAGCIYRMPVQQGNLLDPNQVVQLEEGMTRTQVSYLLGTPMVPPSFNNDRWDYYYYVRARGLKTPLQRRLTVFFEDEKVARFEKVNIPDPPPVSAATAAAAAAANEVNPAGEKVEAPKDGDSGAAAPPPVSDGGNASAPGAGSTRERLD
jgi:outer membrane protein assembly factor BamE